MSRSIGLAHIIREQDGTSTGAWGAHAVRSAFQPIFAFRGGRLAVAGFEGLARAFPNGRARPTAHFFASIPAADRLHVETLTRRLHLLNAAVCLPPQSLLFVNFDPSLFAGRPAVEAALRDMRLVLHEAGIDPDRVVCEVTEQKCASGEGLCVLVAMLKSGGFRIAADDYGADDSDIGRIRALRPDIVKFDARWIVRLMQSRAGYGLLSTMVSTFAADGISTVLEGIEEGWQIELAEKSGASMVQGHALARPELVSTSVDASRPAIPVPQTSPEARPQDFAIFIRRAAGCPAGSFGSRVQL